MAGQGGALSFALSYRFRLSGIASWRLCPLSVSIVRPWEDLRMPVESVCEKGYHLQKAWGFQEIRGTRIEGLAEKLVSACVR